MDTLELKAKEIRKNIIELAFSSKGPHTGSSLSCIEILTVLYFKIMQISRWEERDIFILSKAHAEMALYSTLYVKGLIEKELLKGYCQNNGTLPAHLDRFTAKYIEVSAGSLGHGFNIGLGIAFGFKRKNVSRKVYVLIGDGESQEGSIWEGAMFAPKLGLDNFTAIMDYNNLQGYGRPKDLCNFEPIKSKWESFGWYAIEIDGHDFKALESALKENSKGMPKILIAHTKKGKGVSFMEDELVWHYYVVTEDHKRKALEELK